VGLITYWAQLKDMLLPTIVIIIVSSVLVMVVTGKTTDLLLQRKGVDADE
jgi:putative effector of murein hydrolase LrgA (UPF0299 family)